MTLTLSVLAFFIPECVWDSELEERERKRERKREKYLLAKLALTGRERERETEWEKYFLAKLVYLLAKPPSLLQNRKRERERERDRVREIFASKTCTDGQRERERDRVREIFSSKTCLFVSKTSKFATKPPISLDSKFGTKVLNVQFNKFVLFNICVQNLFDLLAKTRTQIC